MSLKSYAGKHVNTKIFDFYTGHHTVILCNSLFPKTGYSRALLFYLMYGTWLSVCKNSGSSEQESRQEVGQHRQQGHSILKVAAPW